MSPSPIPRRALGQTGDALSVVGFGGIIVMNETVEFAREAVAQAVDRGINYFDVAPTYGNAEERLGPALKPHRDSCFLACKTEQRTADGARAALENSLRLLHTDRFDLYQLHAITEIDEVEKIFGPGGAMEAIVRAREEGLVRHIGFSAHSHRAAMLAMDHFDFDTILFPFNYNTWTRSNFGPAVHAHAAERGMGLLALKAMAWRKWPEDLPAAQRQWNKTWYEPIADRDIAALALRFTLSRPVTAMIPPGHWELFETALELVETGAIEQPLSGEEETRLAAALAGGAPVFDAAAAV